ncbi:hypothetical protein KUCAC02_029791 [Chaenocephalus aceratus]|nr:hypothetical protein KUCAC02_029791 [Chaenocephalus aceratus]
MTELANRIRDIDRIHSTKPSAEPYKERIAVQVEYDSLAVTYVEDLHLRSRQTHYEHGERASKLLSHQLRQSAADSLIVEIGTFDTLHICWMETVLCRYSEGPDLKQFLLLASISVTRSDSEIARSHEVTFRGIQRSSVDDTAANTTVTAQFL